MIPTFVGINNIPLACLLQRRWLKRESSREMHLGTFLMQSVKDHLQPRAKLKSAFLGISKFRIYNSNNYHLFNHNKPLNNDANIDEINIINKLNCNIVNKNTLNKREQGIIIASFFDENLFLVEGLKDYEFVNCLMQSKELNQYYYSVYDCEGKKNVIKLNDIIKDLNPNKNIFCFVDKDNDKSIQKNNFYVFEPNLEKEINDPYEKDKNNLEFYNLDNLKKYPLYNNCVNKLLDFFKKEINND